MFRNLTLRTKLVAIVVPPLVILAVVAAYGVLLGFRGADSVDQLTSDVRVLGVAALAAFLLSALSVIVIGRTITDPLDELTDAADELANVRLPLLVESLRTPGMEAPHFDPIAIDQQNDEMGKLVSALNAVQDSAAHVASEQQSLVRQGLSELVVNLARRNQSLLDRQIEFIDKLESNEEDPDRLEELFGLDHLATRMRRNAESLLVLAGAEPSRRRGGPVAVADILRVAMSEIEDYRHVHLMQIDEAEIGAQAAVDLAHLLSEVMENATQFSPPQTPVEVNGMAQPDGCYLITVADHGLGMTDEQVTSSNHILANPPELGLSLSRSLGFIVIGRLAQRLEVQVELAYTEGGGITALILVPVNIITGGATSVTEGVAALVPSAADLPTPSTEPAPPANNDPALPPPPVPPAPVTHDTPVSSPVPDEPAWVPPPMPERAGGPLAPTAEAPPAPTASQSAPVPPTSGPSGPGGDEPAESEALAKLLGVAPSTPDIPATSTADPVDPFSAPPEPVVAEPDLVESTSFDPDSFQPDSFEPDSAESDSPEPDSVEPDSVEPASVHPGRTEPVPADAAAFESAAFEQDVLQTGSDRPDPAGLDTPLEPVPFDLGAPSVPSTADPAPADLGMAAGADPFESISFDSEADPFAPTAGDTFAAPTDAADPFAPPPGAPDPFADTPPTFAQPEQEPDVWEAPEFSAPAPQGAPAGPSNLEQAIPSGDQFDAGMASLLQPPAPGAPSAVSGGDDVTPSGLVKRDRSKSTAPTSEGRPVKASTRSPEEIRQMLARYRDGRNRPTDDASSSSNESGEQT